ncbi:phage tail protein [Flavitalea flava]
MYSLFTKTVLLSVLIICGRPAFSQTSIGTNPPDPNAMLDIQSTTKGVLLPVLSAGQLATLAGTLTAAEKGMLVTNATTGKPLEWNGGEWVDIANLSANPPLVVSSTNQISFNPGTQAGDLITWDGNNWVNMQPAHHFTFTVENRQPCLALNFCIAMTGIFPARSDPFLSQIQIFPFNFPPHGWAFCNGQILSISQNTALFSLLGTNYGGNGVSNFALPDLQGRTPLKFGQGPGLSDYIQGETGGTESGTISQ